MLHAVMRTISIEIPPLHPTLVIKLPINITLFRSVTSTDG